MIFVRRRRFQRFISTSPRCPCRLLNSHGHAKFEQYASLSMKISPLHIGGRVSSPSAPLATGHTAGRWPGRAQGRIHRTASSGAAHGLVALGWATTSARKALTGTIAAMKEMGVGGGAAHHPGFRTERRRQPENREHALAGQRLFHPCLVETRETCLRGGREKRGSKSASPTVPVGPSAAACGSRRNFPCKSSCGARPSCPAAQKFRASCPSRNSARNIIITATSPCWPSRPGKT